MSEYYIKTAVLLSLIRQLFLVDLYSNKKIFYIIQEDGSDGKLLKQSDGLEFLYDTTGVAGIKYNNEDYMLRKDILGNIIGILDKNGVIIVKYKYDGWGNHVVLDGNGAKLTAENCTATNKVGILNSFRYRWYYYDTKLL